MENSATDRRSFVPVYLPADCSQLAMIKMVLDREHMNYYVENESFGWNSMYTGGLSVRVMVEAGRAEECARLLREELNLR